MTSRRIRDDTVLGEIAKSRAVLHKMGSRMNMTGESQAE